MNDKQKIVCIILALICNFTFLLTAQSRQAPLEEAKKLPECIKSHGMDSVETRKNMAYFQENWKAKAYSDAYINWTYVFNHAPCSFKSIYQRGPDLLHIMINNSRSDAERFRLLDTLFMIFPARIKYFGEEALVDGSWAYSLSKHKPEKINEIMYLYNYYFTYQKDRIDERFVRDYMRNAIIAHKKDLFNKEQLCALYKCLKDTAESYRIHTVENKDINKYWIHALIELDQMMSDSIKCTYNYLLCPLKFIGRSAESAGIFMQVYTTIEMSEQKIKINCL